MNWEEQIRGALARGYCSDQNSHKEVDVTLLEAQAQELFPIISDLLKQQKDEIELPRKCQSSFCNNKIYHQSYCGNCRRLLES